MIAPVNSGFQYQNQIRRFVSKISDKKRRILRFPVAGAVWI
jgi:hypothetical protein